MPLLITGGTGYLGTELVRQATTGGWETAATYHSQPPADSSARFHALDLRDPEAASRLIAELRPRVIIHTAYIQSGPDLWRITTEGAAAIARAARAADARLVHLSSDVVFDGERAGAYREDDPTSPVSDYGRAKATAEQLVAEIDPTALIVRTSLIYGGPTPSPHERLALDAADGRNQVAFFSDEFRCPIHVGDLAAALLEAAQTNHAGLLHIAGADTVSRYMFATLIASASGRDPASLRSARSADSPVRRPRNCALAIDRATQLLTTRLRGVREVLSQP